MTNSPNNKISLKEFQALVNCSSEEPDLAQICENAQNLAGGIMDVLGFEWI